MAMAMAMAAARAARAAAAAAAAAAPVQSSASSASSAAIAARRHAASASASASASAASAGAPLPVARPLGGGGGASERRAALVGRLLDAKESAGLTFDDIGAALGVTNCYAAQLLYNQAPLPDELAPALLRAVPGLADEDLAEMRRTPMRGFDPAVLQDPQVYRTYEAITLYGEAIKAIVSEQFGDGIMSAIDFYCTVKKVQGKSGEDRVVITMNGKFLKHITQHVADDTSRGL